MKLLSRFVWLIIAIALIVFAGITIVQLRADKEFERIKNSIREEYDVQVEKLLTPDVYTRGFASYVSDICSDSDIPHFLDSPIPDESIIEYSLHSEILKYNQVDAVWFFNAKGELFYFKTLGLFAADQLQLSSKEIIEIFESTEITTFYKDIAKQHTCIHGALIKDSNNEALGVVVMSSIMDNRWLDKFNASINNSSFSIIDTKTFLPSEEKETIRIVKELLNSKNETAFKLIVELNLPFLSLWNETNNTDKWLLSGSISLVLFFLILFLLVWVVSPLQRISSSLKTGTADEINALLRSKTEMGDVARMIGDYHNKNSELEASESIKRHMIDNAQVGIIIIDSTTNQILTANPYACELIDAPEDALLGNLSQNFLDYDEQLAIHLQNSMESVRNRESILFNTKSQEVPILRTTSNLIMDGKQVVMETFVDVREVKDLQARLEEEKKKLSLAMQNSGLSFCEYDFEHQHITIPAEWNFLTKGKDAVGVNVISNIYNADTKRITDQFDAINKGVKDTLVAEFRVEHPDRGLIWLRASILISKRNDEHKPKQLIGLIEDITEQINVQQELIKAKEKAEEGDRQKSAYLANMSHKIRTPMNSIVGFTNLLVEEDLEEVERDNFIKIIKHDTESLLHLIDDIINIAKIDANELSVLEKSFNANNLIEELANYYKAHEKTNKIKFETKEMLPDGEDVIKTDGDKVKQILNNLLNNAFKFTISGKIELGYFINPVEHKIIFYVKDTGRGITDENKLKVFNRFYQEDMMTDGTGLGLTISKGLVNLMKGKLHFESEPGKGSTFYVELPFDEN